MTSYELKCEDDWGDGWNGGYIEIAGKRWCDDFTANSPNPCGGGVSYQCNVLMERSLAIKGTII